SLNDVQLIFRFCNEQKANGSTDSTSGKSGSSCLRKFHSRCTWSIGPSTCHPFSLNFGWPVRKYFGKRPRTNGVIEVQVSDLENGKAVMSCAEAIPNSIKLIVGLLSPGLR